MEERLKMRTMLTHLYSVYTVHAKMRLYFHTEQKVHVLNSNKNLTREQHYRLPRNEFTRAIFRCSGQQW